MRHRDAAAHWRGLDVGPGTEYVVRTTVVVVLRRSISRSGAPARAQCAAAPGARAPGAANMEQPTIRRLLLRGRGRRLRHGLRTTVSLAVLGAIGSRGDVIPRPASDTHVLR